MNFLKISCLAVWLAAGLAYGKGADDAGTLSYNVPAGASIVVTNRGDGAWLSGVAVAYTNNLNLTGTVTFASVNGSQTNWNYSFVVTNNALWLLEGAFAQEKQDKLYILNGNAATALVVRAHWRQ